MPRRNDVRRAEPPSTTIVASATNLSVKSADTGKPRGSGQPWQDELWAMFDVVGEFEFAANWFGNLLSRARLYPSLKGKEVTSGPAFDALQELFGSEQGRKEALRQLGLHDRVAGESYIFAYGPDSDVTWRVVSPQVVGKTGGNWSIDSVRITDAKPTVIRTWNRHPRRPNDVTSSSRAALPILNEIYMLTQHVEAQVSSRLSSAGILFLPNEMTFAAASEGDSGESSNASKADEFVNKLIETARRAISSRGDASALVPIIVTAEGDIIDKVNKIDFWTELDSHALELRKEAIRRLGLALDMPPEILTGTGEVSHWQAWSADESSIKAHAEPALQRICADLTTGYLLPALKGLVPEADLAYYAIEADASEMRLRPNRSKEAIELYGLGELSAMALRRETGFTELDAPKPAERKSHTLRQIATMAASPEMSQAALGELGIALEFESDDKMRGEVTKPSGADVPTPPQTPGELERRDLEDDARRKGEAALLAAAEQMVFRALEKAGNKAASRFRHKPEGIEPSEMYLFRESGWSDAEASYMLDGSFAHCDRFAADLGVNSILLSSELESYCRDLIVNRKRYTRSSLAAALNSNGALVSLNV